MRILVLMSFLILSGIQPARSQSPPPLIPVASVDLGRYAGTWFEFARYPNRFQKDCSGDVTATYRVLPDGEIEVVNRCRETDGAMKEAAGRARRQDPDGPPTKLEVRFAPAFLSFLPMVWGDYWIIQLADDYSWSVIGGPTREYLWILSRTTTLPPETLERITARLREQGYDPDRLVRTTHGS